MAIQEKNEVSGSNTSSAACTDQHSGSAPAFATESILKVRKPYTITKQREKWTDEEHQRFLEALKLYGRGWRQIEEHVGTKTAVQIRSHAQKFFSKVSREPNTEGPEKPIEIPPPRPKRKPIHPYPRKSVDSHKGASVTIQEITAFEKPLAAGNGRKSPTSVLSAGGSDALGSVATEQLGGCNSPHSCTTDIQSNSTAPLEKENDCMGSDLADQKLKGPFSFLQLSLSPEPENQIVKKFKDASFAGGEDASKAPSTNIKLFGATLSVADFQEKSGTEDNVSLTLKLGLNDPDIGGSNLAQTEASNDDANLNVVTGVASAVHCMETDGSSNHSGGLYGSPMPLWALQQGLTFFYPTVYCTSAGVDSSSPAGKNTAESDSGKEISCTGSNSGSVGEVGSDKNVDAADSQSPQICFQAKSNSTKGFVPYKRCLAERVMESSKTDLAEPSGRRVRVCL